MLGAEEVDDERPDLVLAPELRAVQLTSAKYAPERPLRIGAGGAKRPRVA
jgi:hypothetical protein